jgi:hypothetical protein
MGFVGIPESRGSEPPEEDDEDETHEQGAQASVLPSSQRPTIDSGGCVDRSRHLQRAFSGCHLEFRLFDELETGRAYTVWAAFAKIK